MTRHFMHNIISSEMIEQIYNAALEGNFLDRVLQLIDREMDGAAVTVFGIDTQDHKHNFLLHRGLCTDAAVLHINNLMVDNPWLAAQWLQPVGAVYQDSDLMKAGEIRDWPRHKDWFAMLCGLKLATGLVIHRHGTRQLVLEVHFSNSHEARLRRKATDFLHHLSPHLRLGRQIMKLRGEFPIAGGMTTALLELSSLPVIIITSDDRVTNMNQRAETLANRMDAFFISAEGRFHAMDLEAEAAFRSALHALATGTRRVSDVITLWNGDRSRHVFIALAKLGERRPDRGFPAGRFDQGDQQFALIIQDMDEQLDLAPETLWRTFRLSNAECDLARRLLQGETVGEIAFTTGVSKQTLRNQLSSIMKKTSTSRQAQLISLLTKLAVAPNF